MTHFGDKTAMNGRLSRLLTALGVLCTLLLPDMAARAKDSAADTANIGKTPVHVELPRSGISAQELALIVNTRDPLSVVIADYYQQKRNIPKKNVIRVQFTPGKRVLSRVEFSALREQVVAAIPEGIQAYALAWKAPYRVECMSMTSAFAFGFDQAWCAQGCKKTRASPYYNSPSNRPYAELGVRPAMMLASESFDQAKKLIDRGVRADGRMSRGKVYLLETSDANRSVRKVFYPHVERLFGQVLPVIVEQSDAIRYKTQLMFYFTGKTTVDGIATNHYLPGAMADHLTSTGGQLTGGSQMSVLRWLEAGATGSYGTVVEPCNFLQKFPNPVLAIHYYLQGNTLLEAYWKSVAMPGQGVFVGEPLAQPYRAYQLSRLHEQWLVRSPLLRQGDYRVLSASEAAGPYREAIARVSVFPMQPGILLPEPVRAYYRIEKLGGISTLAAGMSGNPPLEQAKKLEANR